MLTMRTGFITAAAVMAGLLAVPVAVSSPASGAGQAMQAESTSTRSIKPDAMKWKRCGKNEDKRPIECSSLEVPLDHARPQGRTIRVGVARMRPANPNGRYLFINGGGPGINGITWLRGYSQFLPDAVTDRYTVIGMDPRGMLGGTLFPCYPTPLMSGPSGEFLSALSTPPEPAAARSVFDTLSAFPSNCERREPQMTRHMGSDPTARDMELLRRSVGARKLDFLGISYGTVLGATYADLFPQHVGRMVIDSIVPPNRSWWQITGAQSAGFEASLKRWAQGCHDRATCPFPRGEPVLAGLQRQLRALPHEARRDLVTDLSNDFFYGYSYRAIDRTVRTSRADTVSAADEVQRSQIAVFSTKWGTVCADGPSQRIGYERFSDRVSQRSKRYPVFGGKFSWLGAVCLGFPGRGLTLDGDPKLRLMLLNGRDDPSTPLRGARAMQDLFPNSSLTVWQGRGHSVTEHDGCKRAIRRFLLRGASAPAICR